MADIGVPTFQQTASTTRRGSGGEEEIAYAGKALAGAAEAIATGMREKKLRGFRDELGELGTTATEAVVPEGTMAAETVPDFSTAEQETLETFRSLAQKADSTSGATRTRIINEGRAKLSQTLSTTNSSRMRSQLINEFNQWVSVNPALAQLGMQDQQDSIEAEFAENQMQEMFDKSYGDVSEGGYAIPSTVEFGGNEWVRMFSARQAEDAKMQTQLLAIRNAEVTARTDAQAAIPVINETLAESNNAMTLVTNQYTAKLSEVGAAQNRRVTGDIREGDAELLAQWEATGEQQVITDLLMQQAELDSLRVSIQGTPNVDEPAKAALARIDAQYAYIQRWIDAAQSAASRPDLLKLAEYEQRVRQDNLRRDNPELEELLFITEQIAPLLEQDTLALENTLAIDKLGRFFTMEFEEVMSKNEAFGSRWASFTGSVDSLLRQSAFDISNASEAYGEGTAGNPELMAERAFGFMMNSVAQRANYDQFIADEKLPLPRELFNAYSAEAAHIQMLAMGNNFQPESTKQLEVMYAGDKIVEQTIAARSRGVTPRQNNAIMTLGEALLAFNKDPDAESMGVDIGNRKIQAASVLDQSFGAVRLRDVIEWDFSELDQGNISITLVNDAGKRAAAPSDDPTERRLRELNLDINFRDPRAFEGSMKPVVEKLQEDVNRFLRLETHVAFMRNPRALNPSYVVTWDSENFGDTFVNRPMGE